LFAALLLFILSVCAHAAAPTDPIPHLLSGDYAKVERLMQAVQHDYKRDAITDEELLVAFRPFYHLDTSQAHHLDGWVETYPKSYVARLARGIYYKNLGFDRPRYNSKDTKRTALKSAHDLAARDLYASIELDDKPLLSYFHAMDLADYIGRRPTRMLLNAANAIDPDNFIVRDEFLFSLRPRRGSSTTQMHAFVADSEAVLPPEQIRRLQSAVMLEETQVALRGRSDPAEAERLYRKVLEFDPKNYTASWYLLYELVNQKRCTEAIALATQLLEQPDARANEIFARRGWCNLRENKIAEGVADWQRAAELGDVWAQKELAGLYWFGKHVPRNIEMARHWLQRAAEQGDDEAQWEMQRSFGVTIDTSPPKTLPRWAMIVLLIAAGLALFVFIMWWDHKDREAAEARRIMRYPHYYVFLGSACLGGFGYMAWLGFWNAYLPLRSEGFVAPTLFATLGLVLVILPLMVRHELLADGASFRRFGVRKVRMKWSDLRSIGYVPFVKWFRLESKSGQVVRVPATLTCMRPFARAVLLHAEQAIADDFTRAVLEETSEDWAALDEASDVRSETGAA
jgi:tetratricopeptide (TPR) repeat protein